VASFWLCTFSPLFLSQFSSFASLWGLGRSPSKVAGARYACPLPDLFLIRFYMDVSDINSGQPDLFLIYFYMQLD
jgi:hypothetical protein